MLITRETDYAVRCVLHLTSRRDEVVMAQEIASATDVPKSFLAKIIQRLTRAGLVKSFRGAKGGFMLAREPNEITLFDVVEAIEGPIAANRCVIDRGICTLQSNCSVHPVWIEISDMIADALRKWTFEKLHTCSGGSDKP